MMSLKIKKRKLKELKLRNRFQKRKHQLRSIMAVTITVSMTAIMANMEDTNTSITMDIKDTAAALLDQCF